MAASEPSPPRATLSPLENLDPGIVSLWIADKLPLRDRLRTEQTSLTMRDSVQSGSSDPVIIEFYAAKTAKDSCRLLGTQQMYRRRAFCERAQRNKAAELNRALSGPVPLNAKKMRELAEALVSRGQLTDALRVIDAGAAQFSNDEHFFGLRSQVCLRIAQGCPSQEEAAAWYDAAIAAAAKTTCGNHLPRALILTKDFDAALAAWDGRSPSDARTLMTKAMIDKGHSKTISPRLTYRHESELEFLAWLVLSAPDEASLRTGALQVSRAIEKWLVGPRGSQLHRREELMNSPFMSAYRATPEGRLLLNTIFLQPRQLAQLPVHIDWSRLPSKR
jgi:hypothetical protein